MKLLINLCAHDGIVSHYTGVGTMVKRYITVLSKVLNEKNIDFHINLFTPSYSADSFGFSLKTKVHHEQLHNVSIFQESNGSNGELNYGKPINWNELTKNTAETINSQNFDDYDLVLTIYNDTPFVNLASHLEKSSNHFSVWIPHSTVKIHEIDSAVTDYDGVYEERLACETSAISFINGCNNSFVGVIGEFIKQHLIEEYNLSNLKCLDIYNGEILGGLLNHDVNQDNLKLYEKISGFDSIVLSFGRAEEYKNLEATMMLGKELKIPTVIIAQSYYKTQPLLEKYKKTAKEMGSILFIDPPFNFSKYVLNNYEKNIILVIPSIKETMGLIINEIRLLNKSNILIVSNNVNGLKEQIDDKKDGILVDINNVQESKEKILRYFNNHSISKMNSESQITLTKKYDLEKNVKGFLNNFLGDKYE